jgi:hypothetical protein
MIAKVNTKLGGNTYQFEFDEKDEMDTLHKVIILSNPVSKCICGNEDKEQMYFTTNKDKEGNTYVNVKCALCGARSKLGQYKTGGYFWHEFEKYDPKASTAKTEAKVEEPEHEDESDEDVPF